MTKIVFLISAACLFSFSPLAFGGQTIIGGGSMICETYIQADDVVKLASENWVLGYLSAANMRAKNVDLLLAIESVSVIAAVEKYCGQHDSNRLVDAAIYVLKELVASAEGDCTNPQDPPSRNRGLNHCENPAPDENSNEPMGWSMTVPAVE